MLGANGFRTFINLIERYFTVRNIRIVVDADEGVVKPDLSAIAQSSVFGLQNIAQVCHQATLEQWDQLISTHFDSIFAVKQEDSALHIDLSNFGKIQSQLRSRLYPVEIANHTSEIVHRSGPEGTLEVLALDLPTTVRTISKMEAAQWKFDEEELLDIGRRNLRNSGLLKSTMVPLEQGTKLHLYSGDNFYAASHVLIFEDYLLQDTARMHKYGALVGIPKRDVMLVHYIQNVGAVEAIGAMLQVIIGMHRDGPGSITPNLYWYHDQEFELLPYELEGQSLNFTPPNEFLALLNELSDRASLS